MQVEILHPPPAQIFCPICSCVFRQHQKHLHMTKHVSGKHPGCEVFLKCPVCCNKFTNAKFAGLHKCDDSSPANEGSASWRLCNLSAASWSELMPAMSLDYAGQRNVCYNSPLPLSHPPPLFSRYIQFGLLLNFIYLTYLTFKLITFNFLNIIIKLI